LRILPAVVAGKTNSEQATTTADALDMFDFRAFESVKPDNRILHRRRRQTFQSLKPFSEALIDSASAGLQSTAFAPSEMASWIFCSNI
jgi:hypothetical protein